MAFYLCFECQELLDDDCHPCDEHPKWNEQLICPECLLQLQNDMEAEINGEDYIKPLPRGPRLAVKQEGSHEP